MKKIGVPLILVAALVLMVGVAWAADSQPSAKATAIINNVFAIPMTTTDTGWVTVHSQQIKTANAKDLFMDVALQCGIFTRTKSELKVGGDSSTATGIIEVRVWVDNINNLAAPGVVVYDKRVQTLNTELYTALLTSAGLPITNIGYVELILNTLQAHAFNFVMPDVGPGLHTITVQAKLTSTESGSSATAMAAVGMGSTTIESVRMIKGEDIIYVFE